jgi:hypothetical protein
MFDQEIKDSHPIKNDCWDEETIAVQLVGDRRSKRDLIDLVRWLIIDRATTVNMVINQRKAHKVIKY